MTGASVPGRSKSDVQQVAHWYGMEGLPRFSMTLPPRGPTLVVARHDDRIRVAVAQAVDGEIATFPRLHLSMTLGQARKLRDGLIRLLGDDDA